MPDQVGFDGSKKKPGRVTAGRLLGIVNNLLGDYLGGEPWFVARAFRAYFTVISWTGVLGRRTGWTGQDWALASLKGAVQRMSAAEAPKRAV